MLMAAAAWLVSVALFVGSDTGFEMLALSNAYAEAGRRPRTAPHSSLRARRC